MVKKNDKSKSKDDSDNQSGLYVTSAMRTPKNNTTRDIGYSKWETMKPYGGARGAPAKPRVTTWNVPVYPTPQPIKNMPTQLAGYTDYARKEEDLHNWRVDQNIGGLRINTAGTPASGIHVETIKSTQDFLNTNRVFVNPLFKDPYDKIGNDPDSSDRSRGPLIVPETQQNTLRAMSRGVNQWAKATSKYFNKPFVVGKSPETDSSKHNNPLTTRVNIRGEKGGMGYAGYVAFGGSWSNQRAKNLKAPGGENRITPAKAYEKEMVLNTDVDFYTSRDWAATTQHEFGHTMGLFHSHSDPKGTTLNSEMSYDAKDEGATILPATINAYKKIIDQNYGFTGVDELRARDRKQRAAYVKLQKLNQKY